jgi:hypothetical protein
MPPALDSLVRCVVVLQTGGHRVRFGSSTCHLKVELFEQLVVVRQPAPGIVCVTGQLIKFPCPIFVRTITLPSSHPSLQSTVIRCRHWTVAEALLCHENT